MCMPVFKEHFVEKVCDVVLGGIIDLCVVLDLFFLSRNWHLLYMPYMYIADWWPDIDAMGFYSISCEFRVFIGLVMLWYSS